MSELLEKIAAFLESSGVRASVEFPACIHCDLRDGRTLVFGFANGPLGWDLIQSFDGSLIASGASELLESDSVGLMFNYALTTVTQCK